MMSRFLKTTKNKIIAAAIAAVVLFCLVIELGQLVPSLGIPSWNELLAMVGLAEPYVVPEGELQVHFIDVGNADCVLIRQGDCNVLIDAGERGDGEKILGYLSNRGVSKLDLVIATHPHADHIGAMTEVIENIPISRFVMSFMPESATPTSSTYLDMLSALDAKKIPVDEATPGTQYSIGTARLTVLAPLAESEEANNVSVVTRLTFGDRSFLFMGDAETTVERDLLSSGRPLTADVIKVGHHGSDSSSSQAFLSAVKPSIVMIPCGAGNSYGHPHAAALLRMEKTGAKIYRADIHGDVCIVSDGDSLTVKTQK
jgi:beta-lactamase superfamily II metal-dependent hydrolase